ncbi:hypothetical protein SFUMM280S_09709 [Streptomyces fumanus]
MPGAVAEDPGALAEALLGADEDTAVVLDKLTEQEELVAFHREELQQAAAVRPQGPGAGRRPRRHGRGVQAARRGAARAARAGGGPRLPLSALRTGVAKTRVMTNWLLNAVAGDDFVRTGFQARKPAKLKDFEYTDAYLSPEQVRAQVGGRGPDLTRRRGSASGMTC